VTTAADGQALVPIEAFERLLAEIGAAKYELTLFVAGASTLSARAVTNVTAVLEQYLGGRYQLKVVDIYREPALVKLEGVLASPTLIKHSPPPKRMLVGDMSNTSSLLRVLDISATAGAAAQPETA
jgi:circadian clock protein KaiB